MPVAKKRKFGPEEFTGVAPDTAKGPSLRELDEADGILQGFLAETEGEVTPEIEGLEAWINENVVTAFLRWGLWLRDRWAEVEWLRAQAQPFETEAERINGRADSLEAKLETSERRLLDAMRARDMPFVRSPLIEVKRQDLPPSLAKDGAVITEETLLPVDLLQRLFDNEATRHLVRFTPETYALDKAAVKNAIKLNALPPELAAIGIGTVHGEKVVVK